MKVKLDFPPHLKYLNMGYYIMENILENPFYYLNDKEKDLLSRYSDDIIKFKNKEIITIIDLGAGNGKKLYNLILKCINIYNKVTYIPIDTSYDSIQICIKTYSSITSNKFKINPIVGDYYKLLNLNIKGNCLIFFLGSTIGNYDKKTAKELLSKLIIPESRFICMFDSPPNENKSINDIIKAYDIPEMKLIDNNMLKVIQDENRYMRYENFVRNINYDLSINALIRSFESENYIFRTEISYKYSINDINDLIYNTSVKIKKTWKTFDNYYMVEFYNYL